MRLGPLLLASVLLGGCGFTLAPQGPEPAPKLAAPLPLSAGFAVREEPPKAKKSSADSVVEGLRARPPAAAATLARLLKDGGVFKSLDDKDPEVMLDVETTAEVALDRVGLKCTPSFLIPGLIFLVKVDNTVRVSARLGVYGRGIKLLKKYRAEQAVVYTVRCSGSEQAAAPAAAYDAAVESALGKLVAQLAADKDELAAAAAEANKAPAAEKEELKDLLKAVDPAAKP